MVQLQIKPHWSSIQLQKVTAVWYNIIKGVYQYQQIQWRIYRPTWNWTAPGTRSSWPRCFWTTAHPEIPQHETLRAVKCSHCDSQPNPTLTTHSNYKQSQIPITLQQQMRKRVWRTRQSKITPRMQKNTPNIYCWSYGCCTHHIKDSRSPKDNLKSDAMFKNMKVRNT